MGATSGKLIRVLRSTPEPSLQTVSPALVQLILRAKKLCECRIAMISKCATIGTVQEKFPSVPQNGLSPRLEEESFQGQTNGNQVPGRLQLGTKLLALRQGRAIA